MISLLPVKKNKVLIWALFFFRTLSLILYFRQSPLLSFDLHSLQSSPEVGFDERES